MKKEMIEESEETGETEAFGVREMRQKGREERL